MTAHSTIAQEYLSIIDALTRVTTLPRVRQVWLPPLRKVPPRSAEFGAVILEDDSVGLMFMLLDDTLPRIRARAASASWTGLDPVVLARGFDAADPVDKILGLGAANAIAQHAIRATALPLDTETNSIASFDPQPGDHMGMVGFFPPLVQKLRAKSIDLTVIELKRELVQQSPGFQVTLDPGDLRRCNKILCTSTLLLNDSVDRVLAHCAHADQVAIIGPGAGFFPDPLFARGVHTVGGNQVLDAEGFVARCQREEKWGDASRKYCLHRDAYAGYEAVLHKLR